MSETTNYKTVCEIEKKIFAYKLKEIKGKDHIFIVELDGKPICLNRENIMQPMDSIFPDEFTNVQVFEIKRKIFGAEPKVFTTKEWYRNKLEQLKAIAAAMNIGGEAWYR